VDTFWARLRHTIATHGARTAWSFPQRSYTYGELDRSAGRVAALLRHRGVAPGDRVLLAIDAKEPFLLAYLGTMWARAVPLPVNPACKAPELVYFAHDSGACVAVHDAVSQAAVHEIPQSCPAVRNLISADEILQADHTPGPWPPDPKPDDPALMLYSSGTTGEPKGVVHSQAGLLSSVQPIADAWRFTPDDVLVNVLPLFHIHGLSFATNVSLLTGSGMLIGERFHPVRTLELIDQATVFMGVPPYYYSFLKRDEFPQHPSRWSRLRLVTCGSAPLRADVLPRLESILGRPVINRYGMTECHVLTSLPLDGPWPHGSVGLPLRGIEIVLRQDDGRPAPAGSVGRVWARGPNVFREYWGRPRATAESFDSDGWFDTGDVGQLDDQQFLTLSGRSKDLIIVGGFNVYPAVVERVLNEYPGIRESAVVGVPDELRGERVAAFVVSDGRPIDAKGVRSFCVERLVDYQCPASVELVSELPRNAMGKVLKRELQDRLARNIAANKG
jgi:malonyl-CoA/methylmalonyl-CoA synthetase